MLWVARAAAMVLGVFAWVSSYYLAYLTFGSNAPRWLLPAICIFGVAFVTMSGIAMRGDFLIDQQRRRDRQSDALDSVYTLLHDLARLLAPVQSLGNTIALQLHQAKEEHKPTYAGQREQQLQYQIEKLRAENEYQRTYRARLYLLARRLEKDRKLPTALSYEAINRGWFPDVEKIVSELSAIAEKLDHS